MSDAVFVRRPGVRAAFVVPHIEVARRVETVPAHDGVAPHRSFVATTACGIEVQTTLTTRDADRTRCPDCAEAYANGARK